MIEVRKIIVMTKSSKYSGNCVTGIDVHTGEWIRLVTKDEKSMGAVSDRNLILPNGQSVDVLDVVEVSIEGKCDDKLHPENYYLDETKPIKKEGKVSFADVLCIHPAEVKDTLYGNNLEFADDVESLGYSLVLAEVKDFEILHRTNRIGMQKTKANFVYRGRKYTNISITDPKFYKVVDGTVYEQAYIVMSIGAPWEGKYYKYLSAVFVRPSQAKVRTVATVEKVQREGTDIMKMEVLATSAPGVVSFSNFKELKSALIGELSSFKTEVYTADTMQDAMEDREQLKVIKKKLTDKKKEIEAIYNKPYEEVKKQLDELIALVKEPYDIIDKFIKSQEKMDKERVIFDYARNKASHYGKNVEKVIDSPQFINLRWLNASYSTSRWKRDVDAIINRSILDVASIIEIGSDMTPVLLARYYETLSLEETKKFFKTLCETHSERAIPPVQEIVPMQQMQEKVVTQQTQEQVSVKQEPVYTDKVCALLQVEGSVKQIEMGIDQLRALGLNVEIRDNI